MNKLTTLILSMSIIAFSPHLQAAYDYADSPVFELNLLSFPLGGAYDYADSGSFALDLYPVNRGWADSDEFPYMYAYAQNPPDPCIVQLRPAGSLELVEPSVGFIYANKPTVVFTHGWNPDYPGIKTLPGETPEWISLMGNHMAGKPWASNYNLLWWDWIEQATSLSPAGPAKEAQRQGNTLAVELLNILGTDYDQTVHFIGHSLGTSVNRYAADVVHLNGWNPDNTHVTILDAAEIGDLALLVKPIPSQAAWIDSFITAFGDLHSEAVNVILRQGMPILPDIPALAAFHGYANDWYDLTVQDPGSSVMGHTWSFENGGLDGAPSPGTCYVQTANPLDNELVLELISWADARCVMGGRTLMLVGQGALLWYQAVTAPIRLLGDIILDTTAVVSAKLKEVTAGESSAQQAILLDDLTRADQESSSSYMWIPVIVPTGKDLLSFEYRFTSTSAGDHMSVSIGDRQVFAIEADFADSNDFINTSYIDISALSGQSVDILVAFNCDDVPGGELEVRNFQFHSTTKKTDLNLDGLVTFDDFSRFAAWWSVEDCNAVNSWCGDCDFNMDGIVDANDISLFSIDWLRDAGDPNTW